MNLSSTELRRGALLVSFATVACLIPFINKAYHIDDTLFIWTAERIQTHPTDFYGFLANWYGRVMSMAEINQNPPLTSFFIALVASCFGWQEHVLHLAFLLPALGVTLGVYRLAIHFCARPVLASILALSAPVFMISATNVMSDVLMLAFYLWAVIFWVQGLEENSFVKLAGGAILIALAGLTKYFGLTAIPLLVVYTLFRERMSGRLLAYLSILIFPILIMAGYEMLTRTMYARGLLTEALSYSLSIASRDWGRLFDKGLTGLSFTGGCLLPVLLLSPVLWRRRALLVGCIMFVLVAALLIGRKEVLGLGLFTEGSIRWFLVLQLVAFIGGGLHVLLLTVAELWRSRNAEMVMLSCWVVGTFIFATFLNWTTNGRSILPMVPPVALIVARRIDISAVGMKSVVPALAAGLILTLSVTWGDYCFADAQRQAATRIGNELAASSRTIWFMGHWGFQYYMEGQGAKAVDVESSIVRPGEYMVIPENNTNVYHLSRSFQQVKTYIIETVSVATTMRMPPVGAGFYASVWGPLPFVLGKTEPEKFYLFEKVALVDMEQSLR